MLKIRFEKQTHFASRFKYSTKLSEVYMIFSSMYIKENFSINVYQRSTTSEMLRIYL